MCEKISTKKRGRRMVKVRESCRWCERGVGWRGNVSTCEQDGGIWVWHIGVHYIELGVCVPLLHLNRHQTFHQMADGSHSCKCILRASLQSIWYV